MNKNKHSKPTSILKNIILLLLGLVFLVGLIFTITGIVSLPNSRDFEQNRQVIKAKVINRHIEYYGKYDSMESYYLDYQFIVPDGNAKYSGDFNVQYSEYNSIPDGTEVLVSYDQRNPAVNYKVGTEVSVRGSQFILKIGLLIFISSSIISMIFWKKVLRNL